MNNQIIYRASNNVLTSQFFYSITAPAGYDWRAFETASLPLLNRFNEYTLTKNSSGVYTQYWNGQLRNNVTQSTALDTSFDVNRIGTVKGEISTFNVYGKTLNQSEINQNYYGGPITTNGLIFAVDAGNLVSYESGSTITYSLTGSISGSLVNGVGYLPNNNGVWDLDGTDDYINVPDDTVLDFGSGGFTLECFFKPSPTQSGGNFPAIMNKSIGDFTSPSAGVTGWMLYWRTSINRYQFNLGDSSTTIVNINFPTNIINDNTWRHLAITIPSGNNLIRGYHNGTLVTSGSRTLTGSTDTNVNLTLGTWREFARELNTELSIARIYNRELSPQEIQQNFNAQSQRFGI
jgi:hypothetical protein